MIFYIYISRAIMMNNSIFVCFIVDGNVLLGVLNIDIFFTDKVIVIILIIIVRFTIFNHISLQIEIVTPCIFFQKFLVEILFVNSAFVIFDYVLIWIIEFVIIHHF